MTPTRAARTLGGGLALALLATLVAPLAAPASAAPYDRSWEVTGAGVHRSSPMQADLSIGRVVLSADMHGWLRAIRANGTIAWQAPVEPVAGIRTAVESTPAVGDLDGNPGNEIVVGAGSLHPPFARQHGGVVAFRGDGSVMWRWKAPDRFTPGGAPDGYGDGVYSSPAIGDVSGDGFADVVFGAWDHRIWALDGRNGAVLPGFPFENADTVWSSPALWDTNRDGAYEIFIGGDATHNPVVPGTYNGGVLRALRATGGRVVQLWRANVPDIVASSPAIGDINGDGRSEVVFSVGDFWKPADNRRVWAVHLDNGSLVPGWPKSTDGLGFGSPALGDVVPGDGGRPEVVFGDVAGFVYAWRGDGSLAWKRNPGDGDDRFYSSPSIGDIDGDGDQDVAIGYGFGGALLLRGTDGALLRRVTGFASETTPLIVDFGGTTGRRLVTSGFDPRVSDFRSGGVTSFVLAPSPVRPHWPMFRLDQRHLGAPESVQWVYGAIKARYDSLGGERGFLGRALTPERSTPVGGGRYNHFEGGSIYWSAATGAWEVHGGIRDRWASLRWESGPLGFPVQNEHALTNGAFSKFQRGSIYWSRATGAHDVRGAIRDRWASIGWENGRLGYPTTGETRTPYRPGAYNHFQGGSIYWEPSLGAHEVRGGIRDAWARTGWENGCLGFPRGGEWTKKNPDGSSYQRQDFERGIITWTRAAGTTVKC